jgi:hypothetical protein
MDNDQASVHPGNTSGTRPRRTQVRQTIPDLQRQCS